MAIYLRNKHPNELYAQFTLQLESFKGIEDDGIYEVVVADVDQDGIDDLVTCGDSGDINVFLGVDIVNETKANIMDLMDDHSYNLGEALDGNETLYNIIYDNHRRLHEILVSPISDPSTKDQLFHW